jgi:D-alanyl-D-alanine carboxypeptidase
MWTGDIPVGRNVGDTRQFGMQYCNATALGLLLAIAIVPGARAGDNRAADMAALINAYPHFLERVDGNDIVWRDGTRMKIDDGRGAKTLDAMLDNADIKDMFAMRYPLGEKGIPPDVDFDPGRVRSTPFFKKMYGDCHSAGFRGSAKVIWLPGEYSQRLAFTKVNGAATALQEASNELGKLPSEFLSYLRPSEGTYNCRAIAGTKHPSPHSFGIAIDIAAAHSDYWYGSRLDANGHIRYKNRIPWQIVDIFEKHGFIWGGKWYHYDTMHFEYRPELIATGM